MVYVAIVYYLITEIGGRIVEYNSGLKKVAGHDNSHGIQIER